MEKRVVLLIVCIAGLVCVLSLYFWAAFVGFFGERRVLRVMSGSMTPALNVTDMILVQPVSSVSAISVGYETGDIICFSKPGNPTELIVHRAVERVGNGLITKGDRNSSPDYWTVTDEQLVGRVVEVNSLPLVILTTSLLWSVISIALVFAIIVLSASILSRRERIPASEG